MVEVLLILVFNINLVDLCCTAIMSFSLSLSYFRFFHNGKLSLYTFSLTYDFSRKNGKYWRNSLYKNAFVILTCDPLYSILQISLLVWLKIRFPIFARLVDKNFKKMKLIGPKCSSCCTIVAVWGIVMFVLLGVFFQIRGTGFYNLFKRSLVQIRVCVELLFD